MLDCNNVNKLMLEDKLIDWAPAFPQSYSALNKHIKKGDNMLANYVKENQKDEDGNPTGGSISGAGLSIAWQNGQLDRGDGRKEANGAFVETVIDAARSRLEFYQESKFACDYNAQAIKALENALWILNQRTANREARGVEGEHKE